jgi:periplasmic protein TonB
MASVMLHSVVLFGMSRIESAPKHEATIVEMRVQRKKRELPPPPPPPPKEEVIPPPEVVPKKVPVRTAKEIVKDTPPPAAEKPPPKFAFSVDMSNVAEGGAVEVPVVDGGGNMFADPEKDAALPLGKATQPTPPPSGRGVDGPTDGYQITDEPKFVTPESDRAPPYPEAAKAQELEGTVLLRVYVGEDGRVKDVKVLSRLGAGCTEAAVAWAKTKWMFEPARAGTEAVGMWISVPVRFVLER